MAEKDISPSLLAGSDAVFDYYCQPCSNENLHVEAASYCQSCHEYLCGSCCKYHKRSTTSRHHTLLDKAAMPKDIMPHWITDTLTQTCTQHTNKLLEYFCSTHDEVCCTVCLNLVHKKCKKKKISYVPDISDGIANTVEYKDLVAELGTLVSIATSEPINIKANQQNDDEYRSKVIKEITARRKKVDKLLDTIVEDAVKKVDELHKSNAKTINTDTATCSTVLSEVQQLASDLNKKAKGRQNNQLFVEMKQARSRIPVLKDEISDVTDRKISRYVLDQGETIQKLVSTLPAIFSLSVRQTGGDTKARYLRDVNVKSEEDKEECIISAIAVMPGDRMVVTDENNNAVKLVDVKMNKVTSRLSLSSKSVDVTRTTSNQVAVKLLHNKIEIITVSDVLSRSHTIDVPGDAFQGICYDGQHFILVSPHARAIKKVDMSGRVVSTVFTDSASDPLFKLPLYIALSRGQDVLYVTDYNRSTVTCLTLTGQVIAVYSHAMLKNPRGVAVGGDGRVYVCSTVSHTVHQLSAPGRHGTVLLDMQHDLAAGPAAIAYSVDDETLAISSYSTLPKFCNYIKLFKLE